MYRRLSEGLNDRGQLIDINKDVYDYVLNPEKDYYLGTFIYSEAQKDLFHEMGTVAGITDVFTDKVWWDFDSEFEPEEARVDCIELVQRLMKDGIEHQDIMITFSGNKGFGVEINIDKRISPKETKNIAYEAAKGLKTFDVKLYNASRILRVVATKHPKTHLFKIPLAYRELTTLNMDNIMSLAKEYPEHNPVEHRWNAVSLPLRLHSASGNEVDVKEKVDELDHYLDYSMKPKFLTNCRWALQNGYFKQGERNFALLCLASTYKNLGYPLDHVFAMLKATAKLQSRRVKSEQFSDEEIYTTIVLQVFGPHWKNGQFTCREKNNELSLYCEKLEHPCNHKEDDEEKPKCFIDITESFREYVVKIEQNTITTGLASLDDNIFISTGANVGIIGAPASGKSSLALAMLNHTSKSGVKSVFASLDMHRNRMFEKVLYKLSGYPRDQLYQLFKDRKEKPLLDKLDEEFGNVYFFNKSCPTVEDIRNYIVSCQDKAGEKIKFVMLDYFERVSSEMGDDTAASKRVAGELQDMVNELDVALVNLVQPHKNALSGGPDAPIYDYTKIKGSSYVYQSMRIILSIWRPFYNPKSFDKDHYMQMALLKNDLGELREFAFNWNGKRGEISEMEQHQEMEFNEMLREKLEAQRGSDDFRKNLFS